MTWHATATPTILSLRCKDNKNSATLMREAVFLFVLRIVSLQTTRRTIRTQGDASTGGRFPVLHFLPRESRLVNKGLLFLGSHIGKETREPSPCLLQCCRRGRVSRPAKQKEGSVVIHGTLPVVSQRNKKIYTLFCFRKGDRRTVPVSPVGVSLTVLYLWYSCSSLFMLGIRSASSESSFDCIWSGKNGDTGTVLLSPFIHSFRLFSLEGDKRTVPVSYPRLRRKRWFCLCRCR